MPDAEPVLDKILGLLKGNNAGFQVMTHGELGFTSGEVVRIRNVELGQCSEAVIMKIKGNGVRQFVLAVLPGDEKIDTGKLAGSFGGRKACFATSDEVVSLTSCVPGALAPFSFNEELALVVDPTLFPRFTEIASNAGTLTETIILDAGDYRRIVTPRECSIIQDQAPA